MIGDYSGGDDTAWGLKLQRALDHIDELKAGIAAYLTASPYDFDLEQSEGRTSLRLRINTPAPARLGPVVGDVLHNLRSALDTRVVGVALRLCDSLTEEQERPLSFLVASSEADFADATKRWDRIGQTAAGKLRDVVRCLQPFGSASNYWADRWGGENGESTADVATLLRITRLAELSNIDKHRRLHMPRLGLKDAWAWSDGAPDAVWQFTRGPWRTGDLVATVTTDPTAGPPIMGMQATLTVVLPGRELQQNGSAADELDNIAWYVARALEILDYEEARLFVDPAL